MEHSFLRQSNDPRESPEAQTLLLYKSQLETMRDLLKFGVDLREITKRNIDEWEMELRGIIVGINKLRDRPQIDAFLISSDGVQSMIWNAINNLYIASDILQKRTPSIRDRQMFYQKLRECSSYLSEALDAYFKV